MQDEVTQYTTLGLMIGLGWKEASQIAAKIVEEKHAEMSVDIRPET
jgi:hypothetical protein